jgi:hypothetical protein
MLLQGKKLQNQSMEEIILSEPLKGGPRLEKKKMRNHVSSDVDQILNNLSQASRGAR